MFATEKYYVKKIASLEAQLATIRTNEREQAAKRVGGVECMSHDESGQCLVRVVDVVLAAARGVDIN